ncbi:MAG: hypothetical protein C4520_05585 [Candidatus Abyssobacteria bacterium SURF_5]|uniref:Desulfoferrodoxin N-terminal domain-containing protein n=1 Tax=Abyssobacteria bacterium (strain SURF_5) TaxID=2093360 RepID=A0A3A4P7G2_ABYX5|nr:MAG: hypothetical protein C4520_05585 [Candidatus Abyssubacteria bacterium SURF_5]
MKNQRSRQQYRPRPGQRFRCLVCGAEVTVIRGGSGHFSPVCCNQPMVFLRQPVPMYRCSVCGSEIALIRRKSDNLDPICCNISMDLIRATEPGAA